MDTQIDNSPTQGFHPIAVGYKTDKGRKRSGNEDSFAVFAGEEMGQYIDGLFVVADGMGGTKGGEIASNLVINSLPEEARIGAAELTGNDLPHEIAHLLNRGLQYANSEVWNYKQQHEGFQGMGTTCVAAMITHVRKSWGAMQGGLVLANVGDSRAYLLRQGRLSQITEDHSEVWEQVKAGKMTPEQAATSRFRNTITRAMGLRSTVQPDITIRMLEAGDALLLCSDGLTTEVDDATIAGLLAGSPDPQTACDRLVEAALENGGSDNVTVVALHYGAFTPLETATPVQKSPPAPWETEEDVTDPNQAWKRSLSSERESQRETVPEREDRYVSRSSDRYGRDVATPRRGVSSVLFGLLLLAVIAEGVGLYLFWSGKLQPKTPAPKPQPVIYEPTSMPLAYKKPVMLFDRAPLWEGALHVMPDGRLLVVTTAGQELAISPGGTPTVLANTTARPLSLMPTVLRRDGTVKTAPIQPMLAVDASGNRYEFNPVSRAIDKRDPMGVMMTPNIGQGGLQSPMNLAVDKFGRYRRSSIYVIDGHYLKKIIATPDTGPAATQPDAAVPPPTPAGGKTPDTAKPPVGEATHE